jgi:predicted ATPase/DNA-binding SARP family transcriptional activator
MARPRPGVPAGSIGAPSPALPVELTDFIGRGTQLDALERLVGSGRLLTLTGAGGSGKTRLALQLAGRLAEQYADQIVWVELADLSDPDLMHRHVLATLGVREDPARPAVDALVEALAGRTLLLILDNCEHLADACAALADALLRGCPDLTLLATSREALGVAGERAWLVPPLTVPDPERSTTPEQLAGFEAVQLFIARAQDVVPGFQLTGANGEAVARICHRLDGIPLAIELAAARVKVLTPGEIIKRLDDAFALLSSSSRTALPRHRTLRATIDWSYDLLSLPEQVLLDRLSIFAGGFTLEAAEAVCADGSLPAAEVLDVLARLLDRSLVTMREWDGVARYHLLETVRQYARQRLEQRSDAHAIVQRHADRFLAFAEAAEPHLFAGAGNPRWVRLVDDELGNLRAASEWFSREPGQEEAELRLLTAIHWHWFARGRFTEGRARLEAAVARSAVAAPLVRARARVALAMTLGWYGEHAGVPALLEDVIPALREMDRPRDLAYALIPLGCWRLIDDPPGAYAILQESAALTATGAPDVMTAVALYWAGHAAEAAGDGGAARRALDEAIAIGRKLDHLPGIAHPLTGRGRIAIRQGDFPTAAACLVEALQIHGRTEDRWGALMALDGLARVAHATGSPERAAVLLAAAAAIRSAVGIPAPFDDRDEHDRLLRGLEERLGAARFAACLATPERWTYDDMVAYALEEGASPAPSGAAPAFALGAVSAGAPATSSAASSATASHGAGAADLRISTLGSLEVVRRGELLGPDAWPYAKPKELLVFLALHPAGRTREQIGHAIWPGASAAQVKNSFHVTLHHLRKTLGGAEWVVVDGDRYRLPPDVRCELDAEGFERDGREALKGPARDSAGLRSILDLYRGDLLAGEVTGPWVEEHRDRLRRLRVDLGLALGAALEAEGNDAAAAEAYHAVAVREELNEEAQRRLMLAWARAGDRARALRHYERLVALLRDELDAEPEPETVRVYDTLRLPSMV